MCGRFVLNHSSGQLTEAYHLSVSFDLEPRYNIAPSQQVAVLRQQNGGHRVLVQLKWGLVPAWAKDPAIGARMINARSETVDEKPSFRQAFHSRRCVIPASGFYEWSKSGKEKIPHYFFMRDQSVMSFAGLWEKWKSPGGEILETCTILTTVANSLVRTFHDRMPVMLHAQELDLWLDRSVDDTQALKKLFAPYPADALDEYVVSQRVNSPTNDDIGCSSPMK